MRRRFAGALVIFLYVAIAGPLPAAPAQGQLSFSLDHRTVLDNVGLAFIDDTLTVRNTGSSAASLTGYEVRYSPRYASFIGAVALDGPPGLRRHIQAGVNYTAVRAEFPTTEVIAPNSLATYRLRFYLVDAVARVDDDRYVLPVTFAPSANVPLATVNFTLTLPAQAELVDSIANITLVQEAGQQVWRGVFTEVTAETMGHADVRVDTGKADQFTVVDFVETRRELEVASSGAVRVRDYVRLTNRGDHPLSRLKVAPLGADVHTVTVVPVGEPPLRNPSEVSLEAGTLSLETALKAAIPPTGSLVLAYEYPLPPSMLIVEGGLFRVRVTLSPPILGVVRMHTLTVRLPPGYTYQGEPGPVVRFNSSDLDLEPFDAVYRPGFLWGATETISIASSLFIVALIGLLVWQLVHREQGVEARRDVAELVRAFEERLEATAELISDLRTRGPKQSSRRDFENAKRVIEELRNRTLSRAGDLRARLLPSRPELQREVTELFVVEREYDRAVRDLLGAVDQHAMGRLKDEAFRRLVLQHTKRYEQWTDRIVEILTALQKEHG